MGKSVLLGQLIKRLSVNEADPHSWDIPLNGATTLITCASVSPGITLTTTIDVDSAFGSTLGSGAKYYGGLLSLLAAQKAQYGAVTLLIDTLDLLINDHSLAALANFIAEALEVGHVIFTCRTYEYNNYLQDSSQSVPSLDNRIIKLTMPNLSVDEIAAWARAYIEQADNRAVEEETGFLRSLRGGISLDGPLRQVCVVPVRLALTCETFAASQHVPDDLTVTDLYDSYWQARIKRDKGRAGTIDGDAKEQAALNVASQTVTSEGNIALHVPKGKMSAQHLRGLRLLASEGILRDLGTVWEFFHQTFAEYSYARCLLTRGVTVGEIQQLKNGLSSGQAGLWPVVRSLLLQIPGDADYQTVAQELQLTGPEGAYTQTLATLRRISSESLQIFLRDISDNPGLLAAALPALADAPSRHIPIAITAASNVLSEHASTLASAAAATLGRLLPRAKDADLSRLLEDAFKHLVAARNQMPSVTWEHLASTFLRPLIDVQCSSESLAVLCSNYKSLGGAGRQTIVRIHLARALSVGEVETFAQAALSVARPPLSNDEAASVLELFWHCQNVRDARGWGSWRDLIITQLPQDWDKAQMGFIAQMASKDEEVGRQVVDDLLEARVTRAALHVNVFKGLVEYQPSWVAARLLAREAPSDALAVSGVAESVGGFISGVDSATRAAIILWLNPCREISPRNVWPAQISLAFNAVPAHEQIFDELMQASEPQAVIDSALDTWLFSTPGPVLNEMTMRLRGLLQGKDVKTRGSRARLEGRRVQWDGEARAWIEQEMLHGSSPRVAGTAMKTVIDSLELDATPVNDSVCLWLIKLIASGHTDATQRLVAFLGKSKLVDEPAISSVGHELVPVAIKRMRSATEGGEDSQLSRELLQLLVRIDGLVPVSAEDVRAIYQIIRSRLADGPREGDTRIVKDEGAAVRDMGHLAGTLIGRRLNLFEGRKMLGEFLSEIHDANFGNRVIKVILSMLVGLSHRDSEAVPWMEELFGQEGLAGIVRLAIAKAILRIDGNQVGGRASRLKDRADCPPLVATYIITRLRD